MAFQNFRAPAGYAFVSLEECSSTNDEAMVLGPGYIVASTCQTDGRGRMGRSVSNEEGGLYFSMALQPAGSMRSAFYGLRTVAAVCAQNALGDGVTIAWPCDLMDGVEKAGDIFCEAQGGVLVIGFGIRPRKDGPGPEELLQTISDSMAVAAAAWPDNQPQFVQAFCDRCPTLMHFVNVTYHGMPLYGFAFAVDKVGGLMVMTQESQTVVTIYTGDAVLADKEVPPPPEMPYIPRV